MAQRMETGDAAETASTKPIRAHHGFDPARQLNVGGPASSTSPNATRRF
jgi:hypothetical protein